LNPQSELLTNHRHVSRGNVNDREHLFFIFRKSGASVNLSNQQVRSLLRDEKILKVLMAAEDFSLDDYENYESLSQDKKDIVFENIKNTLEFCGSFQARYPSPVEQYPDDASISGVRGLYILTSWDDVRVYKNKRDALIYAGDLSKESWKIMRDDGLVD